WSSDFPPPARTSEPGAILRPSRTGETLAAYRKQFKGSEGVAEARIRTLRWACPLGGGSGRAATTPPALSGWPESLPAAGGRSLRAALRGATARNANRSTIPIASLPQSEVFARAGGGIPAANTTASSLHHSVRLHDPE